MKLTADRTPVDATAGRVIGGGERFNSRKRIVNPHWETCPPVRSPFPTDLNLVGVKFGRFTVIGLLQKRPCHTSAGWVVRCACGDYETRQARAIRNPENWGDRCHKCRELAYLRRLHEWRTTGRQLDPRSL